LECDKLSICSVTIEAVNYVFDLVILQALELSEYKRQIHDYVQSRMSFIAPNLSVIVGASIAAKIMGKSI